MTSRWPAIGSASTMRPHRVELDADRHVTEGEVKVHDAHAVPCRASATPRLIASVVLPQPPLAANTVTIWPGVDSSSTGGVSIRRDTSIGPAARGGQRVVVPGRE